MTGDKVSPDPRSDGLELVLGFDGVEEVEGAALVLVGEVVEGDDALGELGQR